MATATVLVDPYLVHLPSDYISEADLDAFVSGVLAWSAAIERRDIDLRMSHWCVEALLTDCEYPYDPRLRRALREHRIEYVDNQTICRVVQRIFEQTPCFEEHCGIDDVLYDEKQCRIEPRSFLSRLGTHTSDAFRTALVILGFWQVHSTSMIRRGIVASRHEEEPTADEVTLNVTVEGIAPWDGATDGVPTLPNVLSTSIGICLGQDDLLRLRGTVDLWGNGREPQRVIDAISGEVEALRRKGAGTDRVSFNLGPFFLDSLERWHVNTQPSLVAIIAEACARIVLGVPKQPLSPFREGKQQVASQKRRADGALAYRTHLTKYGAGYRLMLWRLLDGTIEFANVGDKDEVEIC